MDSDSKLASKPFKELNRDLKSPENPAKKRKTINAKGESIVGPQWEITDPNPDIHSLFLVFDRKYFWGKLDCVKVKWSPRMYSCAGICTYKGKLGGCVIALSLPLLKLRPRKDLVETLLHEMIHAYLFVADRNGDRGEHGPKFHAHMHRINKDAGTKITVYHTFHDEVEHYKQHWWRCNGPCQNQKPYFGLVKRSMNRDPSKNDFWFPEHQATCGGEFIKVKEPECFKSRKQEVTKSGLTSKNKDSNNSIEKYFPGLTIPRTPTVTKGGKGNNMVVKEPFKRESNSKKDSNNSIEKYFPGLTIPRTPTVTKGGKGNNMVVKEPFKRESNSKKDSNNSIEKYFPGLTIPRTPTVTKGGKGNNMVVKEPFKRESNSKKDSNNSIEKYFPGLTIPRTPTVTKGGKGNNMVVKEPFKRESNSKKGSKLPTPNNKLLGNKNSSDAMVKTISNDNTGAKIDNYKKISNVHGFTNLSKPGSLSNSASSSIKGNEFKETGLKSNMGGTLLVNPKVLTAADTPKKEENSSKPVARSEFVPFAGSGHALGRNSSDKSKSKLHNLYSNNSTISPNLVNKPSTSGRSSKEKQFHPEEIKIISSESEHTAHCPVCNQSMKMNLIYDHLESCSNLESVFESTSSVRDEEVDLEEDLKNPEEGQSDTMHCPVCNLSMPEYLINDHLEGCLNLESELEGTVSTRSSDVQVMEDTDSPQEGLLLRNDKMSCLWSAFFSTRNQPTPG